MRRTDLEGKTFKEVFGEVKGEGVDEGVVVRLNTGSIVKVKTGWWLAAKHHEYRRWRSGEHWEAERKRRQKKEDKMKVQEMRAVVVGLQSWVPPGALLELISGARKVEAFFERDTGKHGAVIVSFGSSSEQRIAVEAGPTSARVF